MHLTPAEIVLYFARQYLLSICIEWSAVKITKTLYVADRDKWRAWLKKHHQTESEVWLIFYKKHTGKPSIPYDDAVEEALCFGWIDSIAQRIDDETYGQKFTPRKAKSKWSPSNIERMSKLIDSGQMTDAGLSTFDMSLLDAQPKPASPKRAPRLPPYMKQALMTNPRAWENFQKLAPSHRRNYILWITSAKREETREKRLREAIALLEKNEKLGLK